MSLGDNGWNKAECFVLLSISYRRDKMITLAQPEDALAIHQVMLAAFEEYRYYPAPSSALDETAESIQSSLTMEKEKALLFWSDVTPLGAVRFKKQEDALYFFRLSVIPDFRGRGIAGQLLSALENYAATQSLGLLHCQVRVSEVRNINLYKKNGFYISDSKAVIKSNGIRVETVVMTKKL